MRHTQAVQIFGNISTALGVFNVVDICMDEFFCFNTCTYTRGHAYISCVDHLLALGKTFLAKESLMFGMHYLAMLLISHHFLDFVAQF